MGEGYQGNNGPIIIPGHGGGGISRSRWGGKGPPMSLMFTYRGSLLQQGCEYIRANITFPYSYMLLTLLPRGGPNGATDGTGGTD